jgi:hypothetical protein
MTESSADICCACYIPQPKEDLQTSLFSSRSGADYVPNDVIKMTNTPCSIVCHNKVVEVEKAMVFVSTDNCDIPENL